MSTRATVVAAVVAGLALCVGALAFLVLSEDPAPAPIGGGGGARPGPVEPAAGGGAAPAPQQDPDAAPAPADGAPWIVPVGYEAELGGIDWEDVGAAYAELVPLLEAHARAVTRDTPLPTEQTARIAALRADLDALAAPLRARADHLYGNGVFVHPAFYANSVPAVLHARGRGLTPEQLERVEAIVREALADEKWLEKLRDDANLNGPIRAMLQMEARRGFIMPIHDLLSERQQRLLHPEAIRFRVGLDPFSAVEVVRGHTIVIAFDDEEAGAEALVDLIADAVGGDGVTRAQALEFVRERIGPIAQELTPLEPRRMDAAGHVEIERALIAARTGGELLPQVADILTGAQRPLIPPDVLERPIILVRAPRD